MQYQISPQIQTTTDNIIINTQEIFFIQDSEEEMIRRIKNHIDFDDYFGTLATIFSLMTQTRNINKKNAQILNKVIKDLLYLQKNYRIIPKN